MKDSLLYHGFWVRLVGIICLGGGKEVARSYFLDLLTKNYILLYILNEYNV